MEEIKLSKEEWNEVIERLEETSDLVANIILNANYEGQGQNDKDDYLIDMELALTAMKYVANFASDKVVFLAKE